MATITALAATLPAVLQHCAGMSFLERLRLTQFNSYFFNKQFET